MPHTCLAQVALSPGHMCGEYLGAARLSVVSVQKGLGNRSYTAEGRCRLCGLASQLEHGNVLQYCGSHAVPLRLCKRIAWDLKLADPRVATERSGRLIFHHQCCPRTRHGSGFLHSISQAGGFRRVRGVVYRSLFLTADGRPHPNVMRAVQYAADTVACRNRQQMSAKAVHSRRKHEAQIPFAPTKTAVTRAVKPNTSAIEQSHKPLTHWALMTISPPLRVKNPPPLVSKACDHCTRVSPWEAVIVNGTSGV